MYESKALVVTLKKCLKRNHLQYKDVAKHLNLSEASVKRLFSQEDISLQRLEQILSLMNMRLLDLFELLNNQDQFISQLTPEQEKMLIQNPKLLLIIFLLLNGWFLDQITQTFAIDEFELTQLLAKLDKLKLIELLPFNKIKLLTANNFSWQKNGPVQKFFEEQVLTDYFKNKFTDENSKLVFLAGTFSESSIEKVKVLMEDLALKINELMKQDLKLPLEKRFGVGTVFAVRKWELDIISKMRKHQKR